MLWRLLANYAGWAAAGCITGFQALPINFNEALTALEVAGIKSEFRMLQTDCVSVGRWCAGNTIVTAGGRVGRIHAVSFANMCAFFAYRYALAIYALSFTACGNGAFHTECSAEAGIAV